MSWKCAKCGMTLSDTDRFCVNCGAPRPEGVVCPMCGELNLMNAKNCAHCSASLVFDGNAEEMELPKAERKHDISKSDAASYEPDSMNGGGGLSYASDDARSSWSVREYQITTEHNTNSSETERISTNGSNASKFAIAGLFAIVIVMALVIAANRQTSAQKASSVVDTQDSVESSVSDEGEPAGTENADDDLLNEDAGENDKSELIGGQEGYTSPEDCGTSSGSNAILEHDGLYYPIIHPEVSRFFDTPLDETEDLQADYAIAFVGGEACETIGGNKVYEKKDTTFTGVHFSKFEYDTDSFPISLSTGDRLITTSSDVSYSMIPIGEITMYGSTDGPGLRHLWQYDEVDGVSLEEIEDANEREDVVKETLLDKGLKMVSTKECKSYPDGSFDTGDDEFKDYCFLSDKPMQIEIGKYFGANWEEGVIYLDMPIVFKLSGSEGITLNVTKTHEGYFVIETDNVPKGEYLLRAASPAYTIYHWSYNFYRVHVS